MPEPTADPRLHARRPVDLTGYAGPGLYRHYKGGEYEVLGIALQEDSIDKDATEPGPGVRFVIYRPLTPGSLLETADYGDCDFWARELGDFDAMVDREGDQVPRFARDEPPPPFDWQAQGAFDEDGD